uniref:WW domain-containing protein n=1 Tax=Panagrolaimus superbus TaxID=310955 RepID=A0A914XTH2_9BILA
MLLKHFLWLQEVERTTTNPLDICDLTQIYNNADKLQNNVDELKIRKAELERLRDELQNEEPSEKLIRKMDKVESEAARVGEICAIRQIELEKLISQMTQFLSEKTSIEAWLEEAKIALENAENVQKLDDNQLQIELDTIERFFNEMDEIKQKIINLNEQGATLLKQYRRDECHRMSHALSTINALWTKFNDNIRIRRAVLEARQTSRKDFSQALERFEEWLTEELKIVNDRVDQLHRLTSTLANAASLKQFVDQQHDLSAEIEAHMEVFELVNCVGGDALELINVPEEKQKMKSRLNRIRSDWEQLNAINKVLSERILAAQNEHDKLQDQLVFLTNWVNEKLELLQTEQLVVGDPALIQRQSGLIKDLEQAVESKEKEVDTCITEVRAYLMRHDLRPTFQTNFILSHKEDTEEQREADFVQGVQMQSDCDKLENDWKLFIEQLNLLSQVVREAHKEISDLSNALAEALLTVSSLEEKVDKCRAVEKLQLDQLKDAYGEALILTHSISEAQIRVEDVNDCAGKIQAENIALSSHLRAQIQAVNQRCRKLKKDLSNRKIAIERALKDFGPSSEHFMLGSVTAPWQRAISQTNLLPYYIDHINRTTQWDHPAMVSVMENLAEFNQVKFCAYRLAMKLRAIQKTACLDLIELSELKKALAKFSSKSYTETIQTDEMTMCLLPLFEDIHILHPDLLPRDSVILAVDLTMNLIFNIYDPSDFSCRDAVSRILSFEVTLVIFCKAPLEEKYKYLFQLVSANDSVDHKQLAILFYEIIQIPKFLGEAAAFGGSNVEPSVRSCFSSSHFPNTVTLDDFLKWLKMEPQSFIWLPVLHRITASENIKHEAKCNTTSKDDLRDFGNILLNKFRTVNQKTGYLPLETVYEGQPIETRQTAPINPESELIHRHIQLFATRLNKTRREKSKSVISQAHSEPRPPGPVNLKSPLQLVLNVEQMEKDELDSLLQKLKHENRSLRQSLNASRSRLTLNALGSSTLDNRRLSTASLSKRRRSSGTGFLLSDLEPHGSGHGHGHGNYSTLPAGFSLSRPPLPASMRTGSTPLYNNEQNLMLNLGKSQPVASSAPFIHGHDSGDIHDYRLEQRQKILIDQNRLLMRQLQRLKKQLAKQGKDPESPISVLPKNGISSVYTAEAYASENESDAQGRTTTDVEGLFHTVEGLGQAMEQFVVSVSNDDADALFDS